VHETEPELRAAVTRLLDHHVITACAADRHLHPFRNAIPVPLPPPAPGSRPEELADQQQALTWLAVEHRVAVALLLRGADAGFNTSAWQLAWAMHTFLYRRGYWRELVAAWRAAIQAVESERDPRAQALGRRHLASTYNMLGRDQDAPAESRDALDLFVRADDPVGQADTHRGFGLVYERQGRPAQALAHCRLALGLYRAADHRVGQGLALNMMGWYHALLGQHAEALTYCTQALEIFQQVGDPDGEASTWDSLGYAHHH